MIAVSGHMVEIGPAQLARTGSLKQQMRHVGTGHPRKPVQPRQPADDRHLAVVVDGHQPRCHKRRIGREPAIERAG